VPFSRPTLTELVERTRADVLTRLTLDELLRRDDAEVLARVLASAAHSMHGHLEWIAKQIIYDTADSDILDRWASIWLTVPRIPGASAQGNVTLTGTNGIVIPAGTLLLRSDGTEYTTDADATIAGGAATAAVTADEPGVAGNALTGVALSISTPIAGVASSATVAAGGLTQGADEEDDTALRTRLIARIQEPPHGGAKSDYEAWALEVAGVTRAWVYSQELGLGTVTVRFVRDDDASVIPDAAEVAAVQAYIDERRPVTADVTVVAPVAVPLNFTITPTPNTLAVRDAITAELVDLLRREAQPGGTILLSHIREAISIAAGETNYMMTAPVDDVTNTTGNMTTMGVITWL